MGQVITKMENVPINEGEERLSPVRISIIIPVFNSSGDLSKCLGALLASPPAGAETIVVDDGSTDDPSTVSRNMGARLLRMSRNSGPAAARNYGTRHAQGEILFFVDADVVAPPRIIDQVLDVFEKNPDVAAVFGSYDANP